MSCLYTTIPTPSSYGFVTAILTSIYNFWKMFFIVPLPTDAPEPGEVRLHGSYYGYEYRVKIFLSNTWGRVTGPWTRANAQVVCRQLGYNISRECSSTHVKVLYSP